MAKKYFIITNLILSVSIMADLSFAQMECAGHSGDVHKHKTANTTMQVLPVESINVGNKICPVLDEKIDEKTKAIYEYKGKIYNFCCAGCIDEFKKDPEKYIKKIEDQKCEEEDRNKRKVSDEKDIISPNKSKP